MAKYPRTERETRARSERKIRAVERLVRRHLLEIAVFWDEGQVTGQIDLTLENIERDLQGIRECMDEEIRYHEEIEQGETP